MKRVVAVVSDRHRLHDPERELEGSRFQPPFEHPDRAEAISAALEADDALRASSSPPSGARRRSRRCTIPASCASSRRRGRSTSARHGPTHDVMPDVFAMPALREGMGTGRVEPAPIVARLGWWCFETTTPLTEGTYEAARGGGRRGAVGRRSRVLAGEPFAYGLCRPPGHHAADAAVRRLLLLQQRRDRRPPRSRPPPATKVTVLDVDYHHGNGTQQIFYERDDVPFVSLHGDPARAYPYHTGFADETGSRTRARLDLQHPARRRRPSDDDYLAALDAALDAIDAFDPSLVVVSLGARHLRRRPDLRSRASRPTASTAAARPSPRSAAHSWCCRRVATPTTPSARTSDAGCSAPRGRCRLGPAPSPAVGVRGRSSSRIFVQRSGSLSYGA